jgi:hypothetical protein
MLRSLRWEDLEKPRGAGALQPAAMVPGLGRSDKPARVHPALSQN